MLFDINNTVHNFHMIQEFKNNIFSKDYKTTKYKSLNNKQNAIVFGYIQYSLTSCLQPLTRSWRRIGRWRNSQRPRRAPPPTYMTSLPPTTSSTNRWRQGTPCSLMTSRSRISCASRKPWAARAARPGSPPYFRRPPTATNTRSCDQHELLRCVLLVLVHFLVQIKHGIAYV